MAMDLAVLSAQKLYNKVILSQPANAKKSSPGNLGAIVPLDSRIRLTVHWSDYFDC